MFESIKTALQKNSQSGSYKDILRLEVGNTYTVRLLPNVKDPAKTFFHYYSVGWTSHSTGQYISYVSPSTFGERDPVLETKYRILRNDDSSEDLKKKASSILRAEKWLVNAYVVKDPTNQDNEGKVSILRYGKQLHKIIMDAIEGEGADDYGSRIFDLSPNGCNFIIKAEKQGDYPTYVSSKFSMPKAVEGLDEEGYDAIYNSTNDLTSILPVKSFDEIQSLLEEHFSGEGVEVSSHKKESVTTIKPVSVKSAVSTINNSEDDIDTSKVNELLEGLDDL